MFGEIALYQAEFGKAGVHQQIFFGGCERDVQHNTEDYSASVVSQSFIDLHFWAWEITNHSKTLISVDLCYQNRMAMNYTINAFLVFLLQRYDVLRGKKISHCTSSRGICKAPQLLVQLRG